MPVNSDAPIRERVRKEIETNDPPIEAGQFWECYRADGVVNRRVRIIAELNPEHLMGYDNPNGRVFLIQEHSAMMRLETGRLFSCEEFNLRYVLSLATE